MILVLDGPNKAGKSTLIQSVQTKLQSLSIDTRVRHWGPLATDDREYSQPLEEDTQFDGVVIWDRSWASEHVYGKLLNRQHRRLTNDPWLGEFLHRRALLSNGQAFMLVPKANKNADLLDETDKGFSDNHLLECRYFIEYALRFKWWGLVNEYNDESLARNTDRVVQAALSRKGHRGQRQYVNGGSSVLIVGSRHVDEPFPGGWMPFGTERLIAFAKFFGDAALAASWADPEAVTSQMLVKYPTVLCVGKRAFDTVKRVDPRKNLSLVYLPIPGGELNYEEAAEAMDALQQDGSVRLFRQLLEGVWNATRYL